MDESLDWAMMIMMNSSTQASPLLALYYLFTIDQSR